MDATTQSTLLVLESYPAGVPIDGPALPCGTRQFRAACLRWQVPSVLLADVPRVNALDAAPSGFWYPKALARVREYLYAAPTTAQVVVAAGWVARAAVAGAFGIRRLDWLKPTTVLLRSGSETHIVAVPHYSGRNRMLNDPGIRAATSAMLQRALLGAIVT